LAESHEPVAAPPPELAAAVRRGTRTVLAAQIASQVVSLGVLAVMLRLVERSEYGLLGMVLPAVMLPRMAATLGLSTTVLQRDLSPAQLSSLFWLNLVWGLVAAAVTSICGPWLASVFDQPVLAPLCLALAGSTLLVAVANQHQALLERKLNLGPLAAARLLALVCGGFAGIYAARRGAGLWALVAQQYGELIVLAIWSWLLEPWRPGWPDRATHVGGLVRFSGYYSASQIVNYLAQNLDKLILPALLGSRAAVAIGLYSQAFNLMMKPVYVLTAPLTGVMVAGLSQSQHDPATHAVAVARFFHAPPGSWSLAPTR
jgi:O-antigen/teichoic acid export membrane protein